MVCVFLEVNPESRYIYQSAKQLLIFAYTLLKLIKVCKYIIIVNEIFKFMRSTNNLCLNVARTSSIKHCSAIL